MIIIQITIIAGACYCIGEKLLCSLIVSFVILSACLLLIQFGEEIRAMYKH